MVQDEEILSEFLTESRENLARIDEEMVQLEKDPTNGPLLGSVFRTIHTIKGTCGFLGFGNLESVSHRAENLLSEVRAGEQPLTPEVVSAVLMAVDAIKGELSVIEETGNESSNTQLNLLALLESLSKAEQMKAEEPQAVAAPAMPVAPAAVETAIVQVEIAAAMTAPEEVPGEQSKPANNAVTVDSTVRVDVAVLDRLVDLVGELVLARNEIAKLSSKAAKTYQISSQRLHGITAELQANIMKTRMQPVGAAWGKVPRVVRDLAKTCGKQIRLEMNGAETELDRAVVEAIRDPLIHIVRNSCDHGIETPQVRLDRGKPVEGTLRMRAYHSNGQVHIEISDDGAGIDPVRVKRKALSLGLISERNAATFTDKEAINLICFPGFSTAEKVTNISGRGVGMDVVKTSIDKIGGVLDLVSEPGKGTTIKIRIPLTLAIIPGVIVSSRGTRFILPQRNLIELIRVEAGAKSSPVEMINGTPILHWRGYILPLLDLGAMLKLSEWDGTDTIYISVLQGEEHFFGLLLDHVEDTQEIVVKPLDPELKSLACFAGASVLGDGEICLILDVNGILKCAGLDSSVLSAADEGGRAEKPVEQDLTLLCRVGESTVAAIALSFIDRLEEMSRSVLEFASGGLVMQYRGGVLPLVKLNEVLGVGESYEEENDNFALLVFRREGRSVGFVVRKVLDIVSGTIAPRTDRGVSLSYPAIVGGKTVDVLDCKALLEQFDPGWFDIAAMEQEVAYA